MYSVSQDGPNETDSEFSIGFPGAFWLLVHPRPFGPDHFFFQDCSQESLFIKKN